LPQRVEKLLAPNKEENQILRRELHDFLLGSFRIAPDVNAYKTKQQTVYRQLLEGLSDVIESLEFSPFRLRIIGTAGSGKTQVTMRFCERAMERGEKPLLLCFNRPLSDKLVALAPEGVKVNTYHGFVREMAEQCGVEINFKKAEEEGFWRDIQEQLLAATLVGMPKYDCLVVDEGQDFKADWYDILQMFLTDDAAQLWLEDPLQNLRNNDPVELPGFVTYRESANFRTPLSIAGFIKGTLDAEFEQRNLLPGLGVGVYEYEDNSELPAILERRIGKIMKPGFGLDDIVVISCRGTKSTALADIVQIGDHKLRKFTNRYNAHNEQIYTEGDLNFDTIFRYKGQQAPCVILVDLDESIERNDWSLGILYCAMTRATMRLELVVKKDCPWLETFRKNLDLG
jgi:superfamily I DNA and RNA helicase